MALHAVAGARRGVAIARYLPVVSAVTRPAVATKKTLMFVFAAPASRTGAAVRTTALHGLGRLRRVARRAVKKTEKRFLVLSFRGELTTGGSGHPVGGQLPLKPTHRL